MSDKLIDTNILVYAYDTSEGEKHKEDFKKIPDIKVTMPF